MAQGDDDDDAWFVARRNRGDPPTRPVTWQGWTLCVGYGLLIAGAAYMVSINWIAAAVIMLAGTIAFFRVLALKIRGG